jgi:hypothetical protein
MKVVTVKKLSVALDERVAEQVASEAGAEGISVSAWLNRAAENALKITRGLRAVAEVEAEIGPFTDEDRAWADEQLDRLGIERR